MIEEKKETADQSATGTATGECKSCGFSFQTALVPLPYVHNAPCKIDEHNGKWYDITDIAGDISCPECGKQSLVIHLYVKGEL